jgi:4-aminobutyrate aminotransferase
MGREMSFTGAAMHSFQSTRVTEGDINQSPGREWWVKNHISEATKRVLEEDARFFLHQSLSTPCLNVLDRVEGTTLYDLEGRAFLDFHGNSLHQVGYSNPRVIEAIRKQLDTLSFCPRRYTNLQAVGLASRLAALAPGDLNRVLLAPGGTTAVGMALKLARVVTGRFKTLSMWGAFHGASLDAISVGGEAQFRAGIGPLLPGTEHVPPAEPFRCRWAPPGGCEPCGLKCADFVEYALEKEADVAAVIAEPIRCTTVDLPPPGYWKRVRSACNRHGALLIFDETAVCLGRTGRMFACECFDVVPDILILGKGLGGGVFPLAAIVAREAFNVAGGMALGHYTHEKNPVACAAALAVLDCIEEDRLLPKATDKGERALDRLRNMQKAHGLIGDVRGLGLLLAAELVLPDGTPALGQADQVLYRCLARGLSFKVSSGNVLTLTPPLTVSNEELETAMDILAASIGEVETGAGPSA